MRILVWLILLALCTPAVAKERAPIVGVASYYGWWHQGRLMADGRKFRAAAATAASLTLPLGSWAKVTNLSNGRWVVVEITDRGPYIKGRVMDLSLGVAIKLDMIRAGVARVRIEVVASPMVQKHG